MADAILTELAQAPVAGALPGLFGIGAFLYLVYQTLVVKARKYIEMMKGMKALVPIAILVALTLIPATTLALFGAGEAFVRAILEISTVTLIGYVLALAVYQAVSRFAPEYLE
ncbi:MAG TPA: hypothetical protein ENF58_02065 [Candidatus Altiarchaeales archaeon]|nr:MAG: hypothetical protein DRP23_01110 [Thermotogota bacterium]HDI72899.1 hypothetical protein [Candidatus Altiarchaeales archaeon]